MERNGENYLTAASGSLKRSPSEGNHDQHQTYAISAELLLLKKQAAKRIQVCCTSTRPTNY